MPLDAEQHGATDSESAAHGSVSIVPRLFGYGTRNVLAAEVVVPCEMPRQPAILARLLR
jgi:hypothetical protein